MRVKPDDPSNLSPAGPNVKEPTPDPSSMRMSFFISTNSLRSIVFIYDHLVRLHLDLSVPNKNEVTVPSPLVIGSKLSSPPGNIAAKETLDRIQGSLFGLVIGDALGAHVEFRPRAYMLENPVKDLEGGGTWGLQKGEVCSYNPLFHFFFEESRFVKSFEKDLKTWMILLFLFSSLMTLPWHCVWLHR